MSDFFITSRGVHRRFRGDLLAILGIAAVACGTAGRNNNGSSPAAGAAGAAAAPAAGSGGTSSGGSSVITAGASETGDSAGESAASGNDSTGGTGARGFGNPAGMGGSTPSESAGAAGESTGEAGASAGGSMNDGMASGSGSGKAVGVSASGFSACAILAGGGVQCWGDNSRGQLGDGTMKSSSTPVQVSGLTQGCTAMSQGLCAIVAGGVQCWSEYTPEGDASVAGTLSPTPVSGLTSGVTAIGGGPGSACAVTEGALQCWGDGFGTSLTNSATPVPISGLASGVTAVTVGGSFACVLTSSGSVQCWGDNNTSELGSGHQGGTSSDPVQVEGLTSGVTALASGSYSTCAIVTGGAVKCWGDDGAGELGDGVVLSSNPTTGVYRSTPVQVTGLTSGVTAVSLGADSACAIVAGGGVQCWGYNTYGQLGDGTTTNSSVPVQVKGLTSGVVAISTGDNFACAVTATGKVLCWGDGRGGQLGNGDTTGSLVPVEVSGF